MSMICIWKRNKWSLLNWSLCYGIFSLIFLLSRLYTDIFVLYLLIYISLFIYYINLIIINNIFVVKNKIKLRDGRERERQRNLTARSLICFLLISFTENMNHVIYVFVTYFCYISIIKVSF
jgi:hypothetical protein